MIRAEGISKYHTGRLVLDDVTVEVPEGSNLGLIGPGGAGKTLLLKIISGLVVPDAGTVTIRGVDVHDLSETELAEFRSDIGMLFQNYALFDFMTVAENISFPLRQEGDHTSEQIEARVEELLAEIGLPGIGHQYPNELSGGMKKRVSFARAIIQEPPILFYDDPTAGLDPVTSSKIFSLLEKMQQSQGTTSITISHDIGGIKEICDLFAMLEGGKLVFHGTRDEIESADSRIVRQFWDHTSDDKLGA